MSTNINKNINKNINNKREPRIPFHVKLLESNYNKTKIEAEKLWLNMSSFLSMLIANYEWIDIKHTEPPTPKEALQLNI